MPHSFDGTQIVVTLVLGIAVAWAVGLWLGQQASDGGRQRRRPMIGPMMGWIAVIAIGLALMGQDRGSVIFVLILVPAIALFQFFVRPR